MRKTRQFWLYQTLHIIIRVADPVSYSILGHYIVIIIILVVTVIGTSIAIWSEGTHTCVAGHDFIPPNVLFLYKIEINHKSLFILSEKMLIFQVKVFFSKMNTYVCGYFVVGHFNRYVKKTQRWKNTQILKYKYNTSRYSIKSLSAAAKSGCSDSTLNNVLNNIHTNLSDLIHHIFSRCFIIFYILFISYLKNVKYSLSKCSRSKVKVD